MNLNPENKFSVETFQETGYIKLYYSNSNSTCISASYFKNKSTKGYYNGLIVGHLKVITNKLTNEIVSCEVVK